MHVSYVIYASLALLSYLVSSYLLSTTSESSCSLIITGESIKLFSCELNPEVIRAIAALKPLKHEVPLGFQVTD